MAQYVYSGGDYDNAGGRLESDMMTSRTSPLSTVTSNASSQPGTIGIATVISGVTAEGEALRHGNSSVASYSSHQQAQTIQPQQYAPTQQIQPQQYAPPQPRQQDYSRPQSTHQHESHSKLQSRFGEEANEPVSPKATGYQQPFFSMPTKGVHSSR